MISFACKRGYPSHPSLIRRRKRYRIFLDALYVALYNYDLVTCVFVRIGGALYTTPRCFLQSGCPPAKAMR